MLTFEDTEGFDRAALQSASGVALLGLLLGAIEGTAGGFRSGDRFAAWLAIASAGLAGALCTRRRGRAIESDEPVPPRWLAFAAVLLASVSGLFAARALPALADFFADLLASFALLPQAICAAIACAICGASLGLWIACCALPLHLVRLGTAVDRKLAELRFSLGPELRPIAERIAQAHRESLSALRAKGPVAAMPIRATIDQLAMISLELAARVAALARAAPPLWQVHALQRRDELLGRASQAQDANARASFERAAATQAELAERSKLLAAGRERLLARLHEEVAELERARASLALLSGAAAEHAASEIDLLDERLRAGAAVAESFANAASLAV